MAGAGPAGKDPSTRARRNDPKKGFTQLAAEGRTGPIPSWPLKPHPARLAELETSRDRVVDIQMQLDGEEDGRTRGRLRTQLNKLEMTIATLQLQMEQAADEEVALWEELWVTPQAIVWEQTHAGREVAQYVRWKIAAEQGDLKAATEARQLSDRLGLNPLALVRLHLEIERADEATSSGTKRRAAATPARKRKPPTDPRATLRAV